VSGRAAAVAAAVLAGLVAVPPAAARPTCLGRPATIVGTNRHDKLRGTEGPDVIAGLDGADVIRGLGGNDRICGGGGEKYGDYQPEEIHGGPGDDRLSGGDFYEEMFGGAGRDVLRTDAGGGSAIGGPGDDVLLGGPHLDFLGGLFVDFSPLGPGRDAGYGAQGPGEPGTDRMYGRGTGDFLFVGPGEEVLNGGAGNDHASFYSRRAIDYSADLGSDVAVGQDRDVLKSIESLGAFTLGNVELRGDDGPNLLYGSPAEDGTGAFYGEGGDDRLIPWRGRDLGENRTGRLDLFGGEGDDEVEVFQASCSHPEEPNLTDGGPGNDTLDQWCGNVSAGPGDDFVYGALDYRFQYKIDGGEGTDVAAWPWTALFSHIEADLREGTAREVWEDGTASVPTLLEGVEGLQGSETRGDVLLGDDGPNVLRGSGDFTQSEIDGPDRIDGRGGDDFVYGEEGDDVLEGGDGVDVLYGGQGDDSCTGAETFFDCERLTAEQRRYLRLL
jgi:Ca2+-binding RTX toxin-like protein